MLAPTTYTLHPTPCTLHPTPFTRHQGGNGDGAAGVPARPRLGHAVAAGRAQAPRRAGSARVRAAGARGGFGPPAPLGD